MTQENYNIIVKVLQNGAPALANDLIDSINDVLKENASLKNVIDSQKNDVENNKMEE